MKKMNIEEENIRLKAELSKLKQEQKSLTKKLEKSKIKTGRLQKELKKETFAE
jgi:hypothetical protein